jgi:hypothetical protein
MIEYSFLALERVDQLIRLVRAKERQQRRLWIAPHSHAQRKPKELLKSFAPACGRHPDCLEVLCYA